MIPLLSKDFCFQFLINSHGMNVISCRRVFLVRELWVEGHICTIGVSIEVYNDDNNKKLNIVFRVLVFRCSTSNIFYFHIFVHARAHHLVWIMPSKFLWKPHRQQFPLGTLEKSALLGRGRWHVKVGPRPFKHGVIIWSLWHLWGNRVSVLEHLHPAAERHALEKPFEGLQACNQIFNRGTPPPLVASWFFI